MQPRACGVAAAWVCARVRPHAAAGWQWQGRSRWPAGCRHRRQPYRRAGLLEQADWAGGGAAAVVLLQWRGRAVPPPPAARGSCCATPVEAFRLRLNPTLAGRDV